MTTSLRLVLCTIIVSVALLWGAEPVGVRGQPSRWTVDGAEPANAAVLANRLAGDPEVLFLRHPQADLDRLVATIARRGAAIYGESGHLSATVTAAVVVEGIRITVVEGPRSIAGPLMIRGLDPAQTERIRERLVTSTGTGVLPTWRAGRPVESRVPADAAWHARSVLAEAGHFAPQVAATIIGNDPAALQITVEDLGPLAHLGSVSVSGLERGDRHALDDLLQIEPGAVVTGTMPVALDRRLAATGRFLHHQVSLTHSALAGNFDVVIDLQEAAKIPPLGQPLSDDQAAILDAANQMQGLLLTGNCRIQAEGEWAGRHLEVTVERGELLVRLADGPTGWNGSVSFLPGLLRMSAADGRRLGQPVPDYELHVTAGLAAHRDDQGDRNDVTFGLAWNARTSPAFVRQGFRSEPAALLVLAARPICRSEVTGTLVRLQSSDGTVALSIHRPSGSFTVAMTQPGSSVTCSVAAGGTAMVPATIMPGSQSDTVSPIVLADWLSAQAAILQPRHEPLDGALVLQWLVLECLAARGEHDLPDPTVSAYGTVQTGDWSRLAAMGQPYLDRLAPGRWPGMIAYAYAVWPKDPGLISPTMAASIQEPTTGPIGCWAWAKVFGTTPAMLRWFGQHGLYRWRQASESSGVPSLTAAPQDFALLDPWAPQISQTLDRFPAAAIHPEVAAAGDQDGWQRVKDAVANRTQEPTARVRAVAQGLWDAGLGRYILGELTTMSQAAPAVGDQDPTPP